MTIRKLTSDDHDAFRRLRLEALQESPAAFGSDYEREAAFSPEKFCRGLQPEYGREPASLKVDGVNYDECFLCLKLTA